MGVCLGDAFDGLDVVLLVATAEDDVVVVAVKLASCL